MARQIVNPVIRFIRFLLLGNVGNKSNNKLATTEEGSSSYRCFPTDQTPHRADPAIGIGCPGKRHRGFLEVLTHVFISFSVTF